MAKKYHTWTEEQKLEVASRAATLFNDYFGSKLDCLRQANRWLPESSRRPSDKALVNFRSVMPIFNRLINKSEKKSAPVKRLPKNAIHWTDEEIEIIGTHVRNKLIADPEATVIQALTYAMEQLPENRRRKVRQSRDVVRYHERLMPYIDVPEIDELRLLEFFSPNKRKAFSRKGKKKALVTKAKAKVVKPLIAQQPLPLVPYPNNTEVALPEPAIGNIVTVQSKSLLADAMVSVLRPLFENAVRTAAQDACETLKSEIPDIVSKIVDSQLRSLATSTVQAIQPAIKDVAKSKDEEVKPLDSSDKQPVMIVGWHGAQLMESQWPYLSLFYANDSDTIDIGARKFVVMLYLRDGAVSVTKAQREAVGTVIETSMPVFHVKQHLNKLNSMRALEVARHNAH